MSNRRKGYEVLPSGCFANFSRKFFNNCRIFEKICSVWAFCPSIQSWTKQVTSGFAAKITEQSSFILFLQIKEIKIESIQYKLLSGGIFTTETWTNFEKYDQWSKIVFQKVPTIEFKSRIQTCHSAAAELLKCDRINHPCIHSDFSDRCNPGYLFP